MAWKSVPFVEAVRDVSSGNVKVPKSEFLETGALAVVDQGQQLVAGFVDAVDAAHGEKLPLIVFGDHTRTFKFIDFPFAMGADGVKVLKAQNGFDPKYLYWFLSSLDIPDAGYSRHYKFLKEFEIIKPPLVEQERIAAVLDHVDSLRIKRREANALLGDLAKAVFQDMFGDPVSGDAVVRLDDVLERKLQNGISPSSQGEVRAKVLTLSAVTRGAFDRDAWKVGSFVEDPTASHSVTKDLFMVCRGNGNRKLVGRGVFSRFDINDTVYPDTVLAAPIRSDIITSAYLEHVWSTPPVRRQIESYARTTNGTFKVNQKTMGAVTFGLPSMERQQEFQRRMSGIEMVRQRHCAHLAALDEVFASLQHRAFSGSL